MLTFRQLDDLPLPVVKIMDDVTQSIIDDMIRRISRLGEVTAATNWQMMRLEMIGAQQDYIISEMSRALHLTEKQLIDLFDEAATRTIKRDNALYQAVGYSPVPLQDNLYLQQIIAAGLVKTRWEFANLTRTTANTATRQFERALNLAHMQIVTGTRDYQSAIKSAIKLLSYKGLESIKYPNGHIDYLDVATRRAVLTGVNQTAAEIQIANMQQMGTELVEVTAHPGARPSHALWQGYVFSISGTHPKYPDFRQSTGYGTGPGLCGWNCRHNFFPYFEGLSDPAYTADKLREYNSKTVTFNGEKMDLYGATQYQRQIERKIRRWKREASALNAGGLNNASAMRKVREWQAQQRDFINQTGLRRDYFRERAGKQNLEIPNKDDIIKAATTHIKQIGGIKGKLYLTPQKIDVNSLSFDDYHINGERNHNVTEQEAKSYIQNARASVSAWKGQRLYYYSDNGVVYIDTTKNLIRTAFKPEQFDDEMKLIIEELKKYGKRSK